MTDPDDYLSREWEMPTKTIGKVNITTDANGKTKLKRVKVFPAGQAKNKFGKAKREAEAWEKRGK